MNYFVLLCFLFFFFRIHQAGILCPEPILLRSHVLVMRFIGTDGWLVLSDELDYIFLYCSKCSVLEYNHFISYQSRMCYS